MKRTSLLATLAAAGVLAAASQADAAGFSLRNETNPGAVGLAGAGMAADVTNMANIFANPALMKHAHHSQVNGGVTWVYARTTYKADTATGVVGGNKKPETKEGAFVPAFHAVWNFHKNAAFGLSVTTPFGLKTDWGTDSVLRYSATESSLTTYNFNPSIAFKVSNKLMFGFGVALQYADAKLEKKIRTAEDVNSKATGCDWAAGWVAGLMYEPVAGTHLGFSFRSKVNHGLKGDVQTRTPGGVTHSVKATADFTTPAVADFSLSHRLNKKLTVLASAVWTQWNTFGNVTYKNVNAGSSLPALNAVAPQLQNMAAGAVISTEEHNWKNAWAFALGAKWKVNKNWTWNFGLAHDLSPIKSGFRKASIPGNDRTWVATGWDYMFSHNLRATLNYAHLFVKKASHKQTAGLIQYDGGRFEGCADLVSLQVNYKF